MVYGCSGWIRRGRPSLVSLESFEVVLTGVAAGLAAAGFGLFSMVITVGLTLLWGSAMSALFGFELAFPAAGLSGLSAFSSASMAALVSAFSSLSAVAFLPPFPVGVSSPSSAVATWKLICVPKRALRAR